MICAAVRWATVGTVLGMVALLAIVFSALILIVSKVCKTKEDEKVRKIAENLAGANCGGCGHSGCEGFAKALASGSADLSACKVTSRSGREAICAILGVPFEDVEPTVAVVRCNGGIRAADKYEYIGNSGCENRMVYFGGDKICATACLGGGTCVDACPEGGIVVGADGVAHIDRRVCVSCGMCILSCPRGCIERIPRSAKVYVACRTQCKGREAMSFCDAGCIGCALCAKKCPQGAIAMIDNLPSIDYAKCTGCLTCVEVCPRKAIKAL